jgi:hypothetical protein
MHLEAGRGLAEIDRPVRRYVEVVGELHIGIVDDREQASVRLGRQPADDAVHLDLVETHPGDADIQPAPIWASTS